jgi:hypothetical protein
MFHGLDVPPGGASFSKLRDKEWLPNNDYFARVAFNRFRPWIRAEEIRRDPNFTPEALRDDLVEMALKPRVSHTDVAKVAAIAELPEPHRAASATPEQTERLSMALEAIAMKPEKQVTRNEMARLALVQQLPDELRAGLPGREMFAWIPSLSLHPASSEVARTSFAELRLWTAQRTLERELAASGETATQTIERMLPKVHAGKRQLDRLEALQAIVANGDVAAPESSPRITATTTRWLDEITAKDDIALTDADFRRVAFIQKLPDALRPKISNMMLPLAPMLPARGTSGLRWKILKEMAILRRSWLMQKAQADPRLVGDGVVRELRGLLQTEQLSNHDVRWARAIASVEAGRAPQSMPPGLRVAIRNIIVEIASKPIADVTTDDMRRMSIIESLPPGIRPDLPQHEWNFTTMNGRGIPAIDRIEVPYALSALRDWVQMNTADGRAEIAADFEAGRSPGWHVVERLIGDSQFAATIGVSPAQLDRAVFDNLRSFVIQPRSVATRMLMLARAALGNVDVSNATSSQLVDEIRKLLTANIERASTNVDFNYSQIGMARNKYDMLQMLGLGPS